MVKKCLGRIFSPDALLVGVVLAIVPVGIGATKIGDHYYLQAQRQREQRAELEVRDRKRQEEIQVATYFQEKQAIIEQEGGVCVDSALDAEVEWKDADESRRYHPGTYGAQRDVPALAREAARLYRHLTHVERGKYFGWIERNPKDGFPGETREQQKEPFNERRARFLRLIATL